VDLLYRYSMLSDILELLQRDVVVFFGKSEAILKHNSTADAFHKDVKTSVKNKVHKWTICAQICQIKFYGKKTSF